MRKGRPILIEGRLRLDQWDDKQTGQKRSKLGVVAETVQFLGSPTGGGGEGGSSPAPSAPAARAPAPSSAAEPDMPPPDDDVPF